MLVLALAVARLVYESWPCGSKACGSLSGLFTGTMLLVMSFIHVTEGRTKIIVSVTTIILGTWVMLFSLATLILPHL
jgi:hypothetical protein